MSAYRRRPSVIIENLATHPPVFVTVGSLARYLQVEDQTVRKWIREGALPAYRFGHAWRVRTADALAFEQRGIYKAAS